jgi:hypothetical protein
MDRVRRALGTYVSLNEVINDMTAEEVMTALDMEAASLRRTAVIDRLISRAVRLNEIEYAQKLKVKFYGA